MTIDIHEGDWIRGPFWVTSVQVVAQRSHKAYDLLTVAAADGHTTQTYVLTPEDREQLTHVSRYDLRGATLAGDPERFRLAVDAHCLRVAHAIDPYANFPCFRTSGSYSAGASECGVGPGRRRRGAQDSGVLASERLGAEDAGL